MTETRSVRGEFHFGSPPFVSFGNLVIRPECIGFFLRTTGPCGGIGWYGIAIHDTSGRRVTVVPYSDELWLQCQMASWPSVTAGAQK